MVSIRTSRCSLIQENQAVCHCNIQSEQKFKVDLAWGISLHSLLGRVERLRANELPSQAESYVGIAIWLFPQFSPTRSPRLFLFLAQFS